MLYIKCLGRGTPCNKMGLDPVTSIFKYHINYKNDTHPSKLRLQIELLYHKKWPTINWDHLTIFPPLGASGAQFYVYIPRWDPSPIPKKNMGHYMGPILAGDQT